MESFEELSRKAKEWRAWYYHPFESTMPAGTEPVQDAFELIQATLFGHIYQRETLDARTRSLCTIAALVVLDRDRQLPGHITGALNLGVSKEEILELITQLLFYGGYPVAVNALNAAVKAFENYDREKPKTSV
ncbi:MAG: carboxymuconolactone decarboxylase family protein [Chloroflexi bacterium]|nr:carboxymuconolactone decarboxylase family protein [Chloroflexota bacterium]